MNRRQRTKALKQVNLLELTPVRLATWTEADGKVVIERPKPASAHQIRDQLRYWLAVRRIRLDERGSAVWLLLDGKKTVAQVAQALRSEFGPDVEPAEERTGDLVRMLHSEDLLAYPGWDSVGNRQEC